ncbi:MAG TPA: ComF family protein [Candidatus Fournierella merdavium]|mgnify:CR=1 FL=1|uniref:ComF family protein n=1 Tax=Candidatus Allofournierella merdavium TaxID=2838593 RepID=UPI001F9C7B5F|nr:ComF family protein [Candidatus Fournierella merdavium]
MRPSDALRTAAALVYPRRCPFCDRVLGWLPACPDCAGELARLRLAVPRLPTTEHLLKNLTGAAAVWRYDGCVRRAILRFKNGGRACYGQELGAEMARVIFGCNCVWRHGIITFSGVPPLARFDLAVPVPASGRGRGYNPPELLARPLARALGVPLETRALCKTRVTHSQKGLTATERLHNLAGAFRVKDAGRIEGRRVLLVDDVITTGATVSCCASALVKAGALEVFAVTAAQTQR